MTDVDERTEEQKAASKSARDILFNPEFGSHITRRKREASEELSEPAPEPVPVSVVISGPANKMYCPELVDKIIAGINNGNTIREICVAEDMPSTTTVYQWLVRYPEFKERYDAAKMHQMDILSEQIIALSDCKPDANEVNKARLQIDTRKWLMQKLAPKKYADTQEVKITQSLTFEEIEAKAIAVLQRLKLQRGPVIEHRPQIVDGTVENGGE